MSGGIELTLQQTTEDGGDDCDSDCELLPVERVGVCTNCAEVLCSGCCELVCSCDCELYGSCSCVELLSGWTELGELRGGCIGELLGRC